MTPLADPIIDAEGREHADEKASLLAKIELELSVVISCLDEVETIGACVTKTGEFLKRHDIAGEAIVADNGGSDASPKIARALGARVIEEASRGYGAIGHRS